MQLLRSLLLFLVALASGTHLCFAAAGESGMPLLKMGLPVRATALADASVSWVRGAAAVWHNPAGVRAANGSAELMLVHREWIQDAQLEFLGASFPLGEGNALGFSLALVLFAGIREKFETARIPGTYQGTAIGLITAGLMALAFLGFTGMV